MTSLPTQPPAVDRQALRWIAALFVLVMASRLLASHGVSWDQNEQLVWSQQLALGYGPQPPLYTWLQWALVWVLGPRPPPGGGGGKNPGWGGGGGFCVCAPAGG
ncbi:hypothetical protein WH303_20395, partial [Comamonas sp. MYb69]